MTGSASQLYLTLPHRQPPVIGRDAAVMLKKTLQEVDRRRRHYTRRGPILG